MSAVAHIDEYKTGKFFTDAFRGSMSWNGYENNVLLHNRGLIASKDGTPMPHFSDVAMAHGVDDIRDARGIAIFDFDNDGDLDIAINHNPGDDGETHIPAVLYQNRVGSGNGNNWLAVSLEGVTCNRDAIGAELRLLAGDLTQFRHIQAGSAYAGQQTRRVYFGLARQERIDTLEIRWPDGETQTFHDLDANRFIYIKQGQDPERSSGIGDGFQAGGR